LSDSPDKVGEQREAAGRAAAELIESAGYIFEDLKTATSAERTAAWAELRREFVAALAAASRRGAEAERAKNHLSEVFRIVEGATRGDMKKVRAYAELLAEKLEADGETNSARWLRQILEGKAGARIVPHSTDPSRARSAQKGESE
jgi:hypothetical protein